MLIIAAGMPRSASTLQCNIFNEIFKLKGIGERPDWKKNWQDDREELKSDILSEKIIIRKSHSLTPELLDWLSDYDGKILICTSKRDVRDVSVSMMEKFDYSFSKSLDRIEKAIENLERIYGSGIKFIEQDYNKLRYDLRGSIVECANFISINLNDEEVDVIYSTLNVEKAYEASKSNSSPFVNKLKRYFQFVFSKTFKYKNQSLMLHPNHVSGTLGQSGLWQSKLNDDQVKTLSARFSTWCD
ncbi:hypothetical protein [Vibrio sp. 1S139]|uniref:hypothetical protein n=1 Tax=Vibrio sp. 1S139 TaxID=3230006 RepID=UPI00352DEE2A